MMELVKPSSWSVQPGLLRQTLTTYAQEAARYPGLLAASFAMSIIYTLGEDIIIPLLMAHLVDLMVQGQPNFSAAYHTAWLVAGVGLLDFATARLTFAFRNPLLSRVLQNLSMRIFGAYERQEYGFFANSFVGSLVAMATRFVNTFKDLYDQTLFVLTALLLQIIVPVIILLKRSWVLAVIFMLAALLMAFVTIFLSKYKTGPLRRVAEADSEVTGALADVLTNNLAVKLFAKGDFETERFKEVTDKRRHLFDHMTAISEKIRSARSISLVLFQMAIAFALVRLTQSHVITIGTILLVQVYFTKLAASLWNMNRIVERLEESLAEAAEMTEVMLREPVVQDPAIPHEFNGRKGHITLKDVGFQYLDADSQDQILFRDLTLTIRPGEKVGLVGPSGGGKSTLTKLLLRFMDVQDGSISVDGQDIQSVRQDALRSHIAYVPQEPVLFHRSIKENIMYGDPTASDADIIRAAKLAHAHEFISQLAHGYDTLVGERGVKLSGGEKQRIAIARAMLKKAPILILDEATSALDSKSEKAIVAALDNLMKNRTTLVIAHRLSTIRKLDRIIVLKAGQIIEDGSHEDLHRRQNGIYAELWQHQTGAFLAE